MRSFAFHVRAMIVGLPVCGAALTLAPDVHANSGLSGLDAVVTVIEGCIVLGVGDLVLTGSDIVYLSNGRRPAIGWSIAKVAMGAPQALLYNGFAAYSAAESGDRGALIFATLAGAYTSSLTANGIWLLAEDRYPLSLYGFSWAIGANSAFTSAALGSVIGRRWPGRAFGILEMIATAPNIAVGALRIADPTSERLTWGALVGWSGVLFTHGLVSALHGDSNKAGPNTGAARGPWARFQSRFYFGPTMVTDGVQRMPGFSAGGAF
ncbi:MAG TPA: hypothetical protein PK156_35210 [Polyangium sp.]|nr:hypothetical protein [Polyangium sp.]